MLSGAGTAGWAFSGREWDADIGLAQPRIPTKSVELGRAMTPPEAFREVRVVKRDEKSAELEYVTAVARVGGPLAIALGMTLAVIFWIVVPSELVSGAEWPLSLVAWLPRAALAWAIVGVLATAGVYRAEGGRRYGWELLSVSVAGVASWFLFTAALGARLFRWMSTANGKPDPAGVAIWAGAMCGSMAAAILLLRVSRRVWSRR